MSKIHQAKLVPPGAWDTHLHIFEHDKFPFAPDRHFTPAPATLEQLKHFETSIGVDHVCIAHGFSYGHDCSSLLSYLERFQGKARGICVLDIETVTDDLLNTYHAAGIRSVRLNFFKNEVAHDLEKQISLIKATATRLVRWGKSRWSIQILQPHIEFWGRLREAVATLPVPLVVDHFALIEGHSMRKKCTKPSVESDGFAELLGALRDGNVWMKLSAPYRCSDLGQTYHDLESIVKSLVAANPDRVLWGSDWPHTQRHENRIGKRPHDIEQFMEIDNNTWIQSLSRWLSEDEWRRMWVDNPRQLYDYHV